MKLSLIFILISLITNYCFSQHTGDGDVSERDINLPKCKHLFVLPPDTRWYEQPWADSIYLFPEFQEGSIELTNGYVPTRSLLMNYSMFLEMFMVKEENGNIVPLKYNDQVKYIRIGTHKFIHSRSHGYLEILVEGKASLAESSFMLAIYEYSSGVRYGNNMADIRTSASRERRYYYAQQKYYIFPDSSDRLLRSSPAALPKIFKKQKSKIREYERVHTTDYNKKEDLLDIVSYCNREL